jgi:protein disulfide-isomerase A6
MRRSRRAPSVLVAVAACLISAAAEELGELGDSSCVSSLDTGNFEAAIRGKNALVVFFAPWCGHCKALHPHFERLCADLSDQDDFFAAVVDATEEVELAQTHGVTGFPTINWYGKREFSVPTGEAYSGGRSAAAMLDFVNSKTGWGVAPGGGLNPKAGLVKTMDALVKEWVTHSLLPEHLIERARETVLVTARATSDSLTQEGEKIDAKTYITIFEKALKDTGYIKAEQARLRRLLHQGQEQMSKASARALGRRLNVLRMFDHYEEQLPGNRKPVPVETTHTIYTRTQLLRFSQDDLVDIVLEMQEKGCDTEDTFETSGADLPNLWMKQQAAVDTNGQQVAMDDDAPLDVTIG